MQGMEACVGARGDGWEPAGGGRRTRGDPRVQAQSLHQCVVQEHGHQRHEDVGEAHVKHNRGSCGQEGALGGSRGSEPQVLCLPPQSVASSLCPKGANSPERGRGCPGVMQQLTAELGFEENGPPEWGAA